MQESEFEPKITPSSHSSTLRRNNETKTQTLAKSSQHQMLQPPIYDSIATKPTQSLTGSKTSGTLGNNQAKTILSSATNPFSTYDRNAMEHRHLNSNHEPNYHQQNYNKLDKTTPSIANQQKHMLDFRQSNGTKYGDEFGCFSTRTANNSNLLNLSNSSIANQLLPNASGIGSGITRLNSTSLTIGNSTTNKETNRNNHGNSRNQIITDTLPGPESCV